MRAHVQFFVDIPEGVSKEEARDGILFALHWKNEIATKNPMADMEIEPTDEPLIDFDVY